MKHLAKVLFGEKFASIRTGINITNIIEEENLMMEDSWAIARDWWNANFNGKSGVPIGVVLEAAIDGEKTSEYMREVIFAACYNIGTPWRVR